MLNFRKTHVAAIAIAASLVGTPALAQDMGQDLGDVPDSQQSEGLGDTDDGRLGAIVVTARKRNEMLQQTPVAVTALSGELLTRTQSPDIGSVERFIPNVELESVNFAGNALGASIRGLSFSDLEKTFDPTVGVSIDGVFLAFSTGALFDLDDIESIEVLRGPQGTLYGRNTIGGTINIRRTRPTMENGLKLRAGYASYDNFSFGAVGNVALTPDTLGLKLYYNTRQGDSFTRNVLTGERDGGPDVHTFGGALQWEPNDTFTALVQADYQKDDSEYPPILNLSQPGDLFCDLFGAVEASACKSGSFDVAEADGFRSSFGAIPFRIPFEIFSTSLEMNLELGSGTLTSITGYRDMDETLEEENTGTLPLDLGTGPIPLVAAFRPQTSWQFSQELRYATDSSGPFNFVAGAYFLKSSYDIFPETNPLGSGDGQIFILGGPVSAFFAGQDTTVGAIFGEGVYDISDRMSITLGGRISTEKKEFDLVYVDPATGANLFDPIDVSETFTDPTWRAIVDYEFSDSLFGYLSYSRGVRSGGFNGRAVGPSSVGPYQPETVDSYEAGLRIETADNRIRINPTVFFSTYDDKQEELLRGLPDGSTVTTVFNASSVEIWGVELEAIARPTRALNLRAAFGYLDYTYTSFDALDPRIGSPTEGQIIDITDTVRLRRAPKYTAALGSDYEIETGFGDITLSGNYKYTDAFFAGSTLFAVDPRAIKPSTNVFDASVTLAFDRDLAGLPADFSIQLYGRDIFADGPGRNGRPFDATPNFYFTNPEAARSFGVELKAEF